jgi:hypothetical protein
VLEILQHSPGRLLIIICQNAHPHQAGFHRCAWRQVCEHTLHRTGAFQAFRSGGRDKGQQAWGAWLGIEEIYQRLDGLIQ